jgi:RNA polymerase sigma-70 factor (ECF subfamily)
VAGSSETRFASLYEIHHAKVAAYCRRRASADDVDDLTADVFLTVWRKIDQVPDGDDVLPWIYRVAYLVVTNHWRGTRRKRRLDSKLEAIGVVPRASLHDQVVLRQELREVMEAASRLRSQDQEILRLSLWEHLSHDAIGAVLGIEPNAAKQRLHRARKALVREHDRLTRTPRFQITPAANEGGG